MALKEGTWTSVRMTFRLRSQGFTSPFYPSGKQVFAAHACLATPTPPAIAFEQQSDAQQQAEQGEVHVFPPDHRPVRHAIESQDDDEETPGPGLVLLHPPSCRPGW